MLYLVSNRLDFAQARPVLRHLEGVLSFSPWTSVDGEDPYELCGADMFAAIIASRLQLGEEYTSVGHLFESFGLPSSISCIAELRLEPLIVVRDPDVKLMQGPEARLSALRLDSLKQSQFRLFAKGTFGLDGATVHATTSGGRLVVFWQFKAFLTRIDPYLVRSLEQAVDAAAIGASRLRGNCQTFVWLALLSVDATSVLKPEQRSAADVMRARLEKLASGMIAELEWAPGNGGLAVEARDGAEHVSVVPLTDWRRFFSVASHRFDPDWRLIHRSPAMESVSDVSLPRLRLGWLQRIALGLALCASAIAFWLTRS